MRLATNNRKTTHRLKQMSNTEAPPQNPGMNPGAREGLSTYSSVAYD